MLQKTVETYPESADAHSLYAQVCRKFKAEEILIHGASNLSDLKGRSEIYLIPPQSSVEGPPLIGS